MKPYPFIFILLLLAAFSGFGDMASAQDVEIRNLSGKVMGVPDGDRLLVRNGKTTETVRIRGVDCPEKGQPFHKEALKFTKEIALNKDVLVLYAGRDPEKRIVGTVLFLDGRNLAYEIVKAGMGWWYQRHAPADQKMKQLHNDAYASRRGLWSLPDPVKPWEWNENKTQKQDKDGKKTAPANVCR